MGKFIYFFPSTIPVETFFLFIFLNDGCIRVYDYIVVVDNAARNCENKIIIIIKNAGGIYDVPRWRDYNRLRPTNGAV